MKLFNTETEMLALIAILKHKDKIASAQLFANLTDDFFQDDVSKSIFKRIRNLAKKEGELPVYFDLIGDPLLTKDQQDELKAYGSKKIKSKDLDPNKIYFKLDLLRKTRILFDLSANTLETLDGDKVDIQKLLEDVSQELARATASQVNLQNMVQIGHKDNSKDLFEDILSPQKLDYIPTGFYTFDEVNGGLLPGALFVVAANSGGGKSTMANQLAINLAQGGYKVRMIPLEMTKREMMQRVISNISGITLTKFIKGNLTDREKKVARKKWKAFNKECTRLKGQYNIWDPEEDVSMEQILNIVKPFNDDVVIIDYIGLLKGVDGDNAWQALGSVARQAKVWAKNNNKVVVLLAQLSDEGAIRYSKAIKDHASLMWTWTFTDENRESGIIDIVQQKARNQDPFDFQLGIEFKNMHIFDLDKSVRNKKIKDRSKQAEKNHRKLKDASDDISAYL